MRLLPLTTMRILCANCESVLFSIDMPLETDVALKPCECAYRRKSHRKIYDLFFETFWNHYPRKEKKVIAAKAYARAAKESKVDEQVMLNRILADLDRRKDPESVLYWSSLRFTPHPASYLNARMWDDTNAVVPEEKDLFVS